MTNPVRKYRNKMQQNNQQHTYYFVNEQASTASDGGLRISSN